jgi:inhibitor of cysteine peptidase
MKIKAMLAGVVATILTLSSASIIAANPIYTEDKINVSVKSSDPIFTIQLKSNPSTGYSWSLKKYDAKLVVLVKHTYKRPNTKLIGAPGYEVWTFRMTRAAFAKPQQTTIRFVYARPWKGGAKGKEILFKVNTVTR